MRRFALHRSWLCLLALAACLTTGAAHAEGAASAADAANAQSSDDTLYRELGGRQGITLLMRDFVGRLKADARIGHFFVDTDAAHLSEQLRDQVCQLAGGPCERDGPGMKVAHESMKIGKADFNALVEVLQQSMDTRGLPFGTQNRLLARLAPMHGDIINAP